MLAQVFKTAGDLRITNEDHAALIKVLGMMESGKITDNRNDGRRYFDMTEVHCGSAACICGWAYSVSKGKAFPEVKDYINGRHLSTERFSRNLIELFKLNTPTGDLYNITTDQAACAIRNYLTTGAPSWKKALAQ